VFKKTRERSPHTLVAMDFGYTLLAGLGVFGYAGWRLDDHFGMSPWFLLGGIGLGLTVSFSSLFKRLNLLEKQQKAAKQKSDRSEAERQKET
jgi:F0F1-type ATP synthase assembly protein I